MIQDSNTDATRTMAQHLAAGRELVGSPIHVRPFEKVLRVIITDTEVKVLFETYRYKETTREVRFTGKGKRIWAYDLTSGMSSGMTVWDESYTGETIVKFGKVYEGRMHADKIEFERDCYRPGSSAFPLDNHARVLAGPTAPKMERYF